MSLRRGPGLPGSRCRSVGCTRTVTTPRSGAALDHPLPDQGVDPAQVVADLARDLGPYVTAHASGRFFGFVIGGLHPAAWGAELLVSTWDQNAGLFPPTPGVAVAEEIAARVAGRPAAVCPPESSVGFVTGGQMANFTCLAAARHEVLRQAGWDVEADGLLGAPPMSVVVKEGAHSTVLRALRFLGLGERAAVRGPVRRPGPRASGPARAVPCVTRPGPTIVAVECGNVNTGAFDDFAAVADLADAHRAPATPPGCTSTAR